MRRIEAWKWWCRRGCGRGCAGVVVLAMRRGRSIEGLGAGKEGRGREGGARFRGAEGMNAEGEEGRSRTEEKKKRGSGGRYYKKRRGREVKGREVLK